MTRTSPTGPQDLVEHALATSTADDCIAIVHNHTSANLRWANNTLTTNGVMHGVGVTVISFARTADGGVATGSVSGSASATAQVTALVEAADAAAKAGSAAEDVADLVTGTAAADWDDAPGETDIHVYDAFAPALGEAFGRAEAGGRVLYGFVNHGVTTTYLGSSTGLRLRHVQPTGHYGCTGKTADRRRSAWVGGATRDFAGVDALALGRDRSSSGSAGATARSTCPAGRYDTILPPSLGGRPDDRRLLVRRRPDRPRGPVGLQQARRGHPDRRADRPGGRAPVLRPGLRRPRVHAVRDGGDLGQRGVGLRQRPAAGAHRLDRRRPSRCADPDPLTPRR